jgi:hypothetical protein
MLTKSASAGFTWDGVWVGVGVGVGVGFGGLALLPGGAADAFVTSVVVATSEQAATSIALMAIRSLIVRPVLSVSAPYEA